MYRDLKNIKKIGIIGAGTMGQGISQAVALSGYEVLLYDQDAAISDLGIENIKKSLQKGVSLNKIKAKQAKEAAKRITKIANIADLKADLIIEAIIEQLEVKKRVLQEVEKHNHSSSIIASNTSSISISEIARGLSRPENSIGIHFFNPANIMELVEIVEGSLTSGETVAVAKAFITSLNKKPVTVKDAPGFIVNRVARHFYVESLKIAEEEIADFESIDKLMEATGFKMGPFKLMDLIGIDTNFAVTTSIYNAFHQEPRFRPSRLQNQKILAGQLGKKSGKGFYDY